MAIVVKFKRGLKKSLPKEAGLGEPLFCTDSLELYMGMGDGKPIKIIGIIDPDDFEAIHKYYDKLVARKYSTWYFDNKSVDDNGIQTLD
jgi:hypothetical protein